MGDKRFIQIVFEFVIGIFMMVPLYVFHSDKSVWIVIMKLLYSFGVMLAMTKVMSMLCRLICSIFRGIMVQHQKSYGVLCLIFICFGVVVWKLYPSHFEKGYFVAEIIAYVLFVLWFMMDINTTKCYWSIILLYSILNSEVDDHKKYVDTYKKNIDGISNRKDALIKELEQYFPKRLLGDPLKELKKDLDISRVDNYLKKSPAFHGEYRGIGGLLYGWSNVIRFKYDIEHYLDNLAVDEQWMGQEKQAYDDYISNMEKIVTHIQESGKMVGTMEELGFNSSKYQKIWKGDIADAGNSRKNIKDIWKMNKKINKLRRKNYGR